MNVSIHKLEVVFYQTDTGSEPVRDWLKSLSIDDKRIIGEDIKTVQFGWPLGIPLVDSLNHGLWEVRSRLSAGRIARIIFFMDENAMVIVNGFMKKSCKTPKDILEISRKRKRLYFTNK